MKLIRIISLISCLLISQSLLSQAPEWSIKASDYQYSMNITGSYFNNCLFTGEVDDIVGAFVGDELRGTAMVSEEVEGKALAYLTVFSNEAVGETVTFKYYDQTSGVLIELAATTEFLEGKILGGRMVPFQFFEDEPANVPELFFEDGTILITNEEDNYSSYQWFRNDQLIPGATQEFLNTAQIGTYSVEIVTDGGCKVSSQDFLIESGVTGIEDMIFDLSVYPNPTADLVTIKSDILSSQVSEVSLFNLSGQFLPIVSRKIASNKIQVDLSQLEPGAYFIVLQAESLFQERIVLKK
ncbi:MAG: T9SS type A sorting domain-containing protein [Cyclobacteriaceae bacterium]